MRDYLYKSNPARESMLEMFCGQAIFYYICTAYNEKQMEGKFPNSVAIPPYYGAPLSHDGKHAQ
ncbi:hypothetical protein HMPREF0658_0072 [Hoylesella marshii DSM 16973 = JCM 13450]|uniref:Uncharacterized protein n=1 Tax=Hoylesella marshii DSM 16973 = JCM 13450 TaxID=862515 RepID=E0NPH1_9BACT|nr:hypothetical protein HMPREF0658_0072 [Hoylesella marshii DSM 16973 = JCM 13450]